MNHPDPYRAPAEVGVASKRSLIKSPLVWVAAGAVIVAGAVFLGRAKTSVEEFGLHRAGPPREYETLQYEERGVEQEAAPSPPGE
jgi:hypothetical protein